MPDLEADLRATGDVLAGYQRLQTRGLASDDDQARGLNADGMQTLADLLAVLVFQAGTGGSKTERVASASGRAMLSALGDLYDEIGGRSTSGDQTNHLLRNAVKEARR